MKLKITANDPLHFGSGKSMAAGESSFGADMFPPFPTVFLGAFRSAWLSRNAQFIKDANDPVIDPTYNYHITFYTLLLNGVLHFPAPMDTYVVGDMPGLCQLELRENDGLSNHSLPYYLWADHDGKIANPVGRWISLESFSSYLHCSDDRVQSVKLSNYIKRETRIGIARDKARRAAADAMLYNTVLTRLDGVDFAVELEGESLPESCGLIRLGKFGKTANYTKADYRNEISPGVINEQGVFKLYFATPAIFNGGTEPTLPEGLPKVELIAAATSGYENIGGYDLKLNRPKPMMRAVKAGSIFYYRLVDNTEAHRKLIVTKLHGHCISQVNQHAGLGLCYVGSIVR